MSEYQVLLDGVRNPARHTVTNYESNIDELTIEELRQAIKLSNIEADTYLMLIDTIGRSRLETVGLKKLDVLENRRKKFLTRLASLSHK